MIESAYLLSLCRACSKYISTKIFKKKQSNLIDSQNTERQSKEKYLGASDLEFCACSILLDFDISGVLSMIDKNGREKMLFHSHQQT